MVTAKKFYSALGTTQGRGFEVWYGMRSNESRKRGEKYGLMTSDDLFYINEVFPSQYPKYFQKMGILMRLPIVNFNEEQVFELLDGEENPLYRNGFDRVGCFP